MIYSGERGTNGNSERRWRRKDGLKKELWVEEGRVGWRRKNGWRREDRLEKKGWAGEGMVV